MKVWVQQQFNHISVFPATAPIPSWRYLFCAIISRLACCFVFLRRSLLWLGHTIQGANEARGPLAYGLKLNKGYALYTNPIWPHLRLGPSHLVTNVCVTAATGPTRVAPALLLLHLITVGLRREESSFGERVCNPI